MLRRRWPFVLAGGRAGHREVGDLRPIGGYGGCDVSRVRAQHARRRPGGQVAAEDVLDERAEREGAAREAQDVRIGRRVRALELGLAPGPAEHLPRARAVRVRDPEPRRVVARLSCQTMSPFRPGGVADAGAASTPARINAARQQGGAGTCAPPVDVVGQPSPTVLEASTTMVRLVTSRVPASVPSLGLLAPPRARSSVGERSLHTREVAGSKPAAPIV